MLVGRIVILTFLNILTNHDAYWPFTLVFSLYLFLTELLPCCYVVYSMFKRLKVYRKATRLLSETSNSSSSRNTEFDLTRSKASELIAA